MFKPNSPDDTLISLNAEQQSILDDRDNYDYLLRKILWREKLVNQIAHKIRQSLKLEEVLQTSTEEVRKFLKTDRVLLYHFADDWSGSVIIESVSPECMSILGKNIQDNCFQNNYAHLYLDGRIRAIDDIYIAGLASCHVALLAELQVRANLIVPVINNNVLWGLIIAHNCQSPRHWKDFEIELLKQLSVQLAIAIQQANLYEKLQVQIAQLTIKSSDRQEDAALNTLQKIKNLLQREDISWNNLTEVIEQTLEDALQGKITWLRNK